MKYNILFLGLGSIGKRHLRNVSELLKNRGIEFQIDAVRNDVNRKLELDIQDLVSECFTYDDKIYKNYDIIFVTNPTFKHYDTIKQYSDIAKNMFIEKPVFDLYSYNISELNLKKEGVYYVACPLRYNAVLQYIHKNVECNKAISVRSISSSYLPDWRAGTDYRNTYSARKSMGGGVSVDLIHEWDYLVWLFGYPDKVSCIIEKKSGLEIDSDDIAIYIARNKNMTYEVHLDYFGRKVIRQLQIFLPDETIEADIANGQIRYLTRNETINLTEDRNSFQFKELEHFFDIVEGKIKNDSDIADAQKVLKITGGFYE